MPFEFKQLEIPDVILIIPKVFGDQRGFFMETYKAPDFQKNGIQFDFIQDNHSKSKKGVIRGLHYQLPPKAQGKLVRVAQGKLLDVVVDIRKGSPYYGKWLAVELSGENKHMLWVPPGFAHGVCTLEDGTELLYKATDVYSPNDERGIRWDDPEIGIDWPLDNPELSEKDAVLPSLSGAENNFIYEKIEKEIA